MRNTVINVVDNVAATVANGASVTGVLYLGGLRLFGIITPATITGSVLTFQASADGVNYYNVYDADGNELSVQVGASRFVALDPVPFAAAAFIKVRSGTSGTPVVQGQETALQLVLRGI